MGGSLEKVITGGTGHTLLNLEERGPRRKKRVCNKRHKSRQYQGKGAKKNKSGYLSSGLFVEKNPVIRSPNRGGKWDQSKIGECHGEGKGEMGGPKPDGVYKTSAFPIEKQLGGEGKGDKTWMDLSYRSTNNSTGAQTKRNTEGERRSTNRSVG